MSTTNPSPSPNTLGQRRTASGRPMSLIQPCPVGWCNSPGHRGILDEDSHFARGGNLKLSLYHGAPGGDDELPTIDVDLEQKFDSADAPTVSLGTDWALVDLTAGEAAELGRLLLDAAGRSYAIQAGPPATKSRLAAALVWACAADAAVFGALAVASAFTAGWWALLPLLGAVLGAGLGVVLYRHAAGR